jgi:hypothetical protein
MNKLEYYKRQKVGWDNKELQDIRMEYETKGLNISEIADIHYRTPGSISYKLQSLGIITHNVLSRGYLEYKNSALYNEIIEKTMDDNAKKEKKKAELQYKNANAPSVTTSSNEIIKSSETVATSHEELESNTKARGSRVRNEIAELKKDVKEILRLMNALYDFESQ